MNKATTIFIDTQDMEERYGEQLYQEYLEEENKQLKDKVNQLEEKEELHLNRIDELTDRVVKLETNRDETIEYIKHSWWLRTDQVYDTSKDLKGWEVEELLSILERGKG